MITPNWPVRFIYWSLKMPALTLKAFIVLWVASPRSSILLRISFSSRFKTSYSRYYVFYKQTFHIVYQLMFDASWPGIFIFGLVLFPGFLCVFQLGLDLIHMKIIKLGCVEVELEGIHRFYVVIIHFDQFSSSLLTKLLRKLVMYLLENDPLCSIYFWYSCQSIFFFHVRSPVRIISSAPWLIVWFWISRNPFYGFLDLS